MMNIKQVMIAMVAALLAVSVSASEPAPSVDADANKHKCYMEDQRNSEFCQRVMFPPVPFR
ncbi:hypothetical protein [Oceanicoccus sagamiensis]|uniref:Uncharacterized protein n=1 Tax=Oceanicoccus sagamiensis TaxID=716816 RepID=A0A1X9N6N1_9GAMM|nr:hypothetical protein [Oceanicoccus sagamiensis]ARN72901.1 hypothetical protein BST96_01545 [Oceanicoccus sagamiensis]